MAAGAQTEACSPNTVGDSSPTRSGGATAARTEAGEGRWCAAGYAEGANYRSVGPLCKDAIFQFRIV